MAQPHVLLIDDDPDLLGLMRDAFEDEGALVDTAGDGLAGMKAFVAGRADLVVTDIIMPTREGLETILELKRQSPGVKIVAISGGGRLSGATFLDLAKSFGANVTLAKPFRLADLVSQSLMLLDPQPTIAAA